MSLTTVSRINAAVLKFGGALNESLGQPVGVSLVSAFGTMLAEIMQALYDDVTGAN